MGLRGVRIGRHLHKIDIFYDLCRILERNVVSEGKTLILLKQPKNGEKVTFHECYETGTAHGVEA